PSPGNRRSTKRLRHISLNIKGFGAQPPLCPLFQGERMKTRAAVAWKAGEPLTIEEVELQGPKAFEVLVEVKATGICHTDYYTLSGADPEGLFPAILGHEGAGVVLEVGSGVTSLKP